MQAPQCRVDSWPQVPQNPLAHMRHSSSSKAGAAMREPIAGPLECCCGEARSRARAVRPPLARQRRSVVTLAVIRALGVVVTLGSAVSAQSVGGQREQCGRCEIMLEKVATFGAGDTTGMLSVLPTSMHLDRAGRYWLANGQDLAVVHTPDGRSRAVGSKGRGPGEFVRVGEIVPLPGDSVLLIDHAEYRATVVGPDLQIVRTILLDMVPQRTAVASWPDNVWMTGSWSTPSSAGRPLHRFRLGGAASVFVGSFGTGSDELRAGGMTPLLRLAQAAGGRLWTLERHSNLLTLWTASGQAVRTSRRQPAWFKPNANQPMGNPTTPPSATVRLISEDASGYLWIVAETPSPDWTAAWENFPVNPSGGRGEVSTRSIATDRLWKSRIEVLDAATGRLVAERQLDEWVIAMPAQRLIATGRLDSLGIPVVTVSRVSLK